MRNVANNQGMTLVEVTIASAIGAVVMLGLMAAQGQLGRAVKGVTNKSNVISDHSNIISVLSSADTCADALRSGSGSNARGMVMAERGAVYADGVERIVLPGTSTVIVQRGVVREGLRLESIQMITSDAGFQHVSGNNWEADVRMVLRWAEANSGELRALGNQSFERMLALRVTINSPAAPSGKQNIQSCSFTTSSSGTLANEEQMCLVMGGTYDADAPNSRCLLTRSGIATTVADRTDGLSRLIPEAGFYVGGQLLVQNNSTSPNGNLRTSRIVSSQDSANNSDALVDSARAGAGIGGAYLRALRTDSGGGHGYLHVARTGTGDGNAVIFLEKAGPGAGDSEVTFSKAGTGTGDAIVRVRHAGTGASSGAARMILSREGTNFGNSELLVQRIQASSSDARITSYANADNRSTIESIATTTSPVVQSAVFSQNTGLRPLLRTLRAGNGSIPGAMNDMLTSSSQPLGSFEAAGVVGGSIQHFGQIGFHTRATAADPITLINRPASFEILLGQRLSSDLKRVVEIAPQPAGSRHTAAIDAELALTDNGNVRLRADADTIGSPTLNTVPVSVNNQGQMRWKELTSWTLDRPLFHTTTTSCSITNIASHYAAGTSRATGGGNALNFGCNSNPTEGICVALTARAQADGISQVVSCSLNHVRNDLGAGGAGHGGSKCEVKNEGGQWVIKANSWNGTNPPNPLVEGNCVECSATCIGWKNTPDT